MPIYRLWRAADDEFFEQDAHDDGHALELFGEQLGLKLSLEEADEVAPFLMQRMHNEVAWTSKPSMPVYIDKAAT